jgi:hypothetical protein
MDVYKLDTFTRQFLETALWAECDHDKEDSPSLDRDFDITDIAEETVIKLKRDCDSFRETNKELLEQAGDDEQNGHDFWLSRNGHGCGFWDRGYGTAGTKLHEATKPYGSVFLYILDGKIHCD